MSFQIMCFYGIYFGYLLSSAYFYYEKLSTELKLDAEQFCELQWIVFHSLNHLAVIGASVSIAKEV